MPERAKELFLQYHGNRFYMDHDGVGQEYDAYHVPKETEALWAEECIRDFLNTEKQGKSALKAYSAAADLVKTGREDGIWERCLYYPLRAGHLDDVTVLFMLGISFRMAKRAARKHALSREEAAAYAEALDAYSLQVLDRADRGVLTRADDYVMQEFSDPSYVGRYLDDLKMKWSGLDAFLSA